MKGSNDRFAFACGILLASLVSGCEGATEEVFPILDTLQVWRAEIELAVGADSSEGPGVIRPVPLGANGMGDIYLLDVGLLEVQHYDSAGRYQGLLVGPGQGPGEIRARPLNFGLVDQGVWYAEPPSGRVHFVSFDGRERRVEDTGLSFAAMGAQSVRIEKLEGWLAPHYLIETLRADPTDRSLRPTVQVGLYRSDGQAIDTLHEFSMMARHLVLDGGMSSVTFPGPAFHPIVLYDEGRREVVIIERPLQPAGTIAIQIINESGSVIRRRNLRVVTPEITADHQARIKETLLRTASFGGARTVDRSLREELARVVDELPERFPAFDEAVRGPESTIWLRRAGLDLDVHREWLVLDGSLNPMARALVPIGASELSFRNDGSWWAVMDAWLGNPYIARLSFTEAHSGY